MSGRLVISRHKSWHVWNQDNREKVLRDERLHREEVQAKEQEEKRRQQEHNLQQLKTSTDHNASSSHNVLVDEDKPVEAFRLFADLEAKSHPEGNPEYLQEKKKKEQLKRKREGIQDWALGEGSLESSHSKPWFHDKHDSKKALSKEEERIRQQEDPMHTFLQQKSCEWIESKESNDIQPYYESTRRSTYDKSDKHEKHRKNKVSDREFYDRSIESRPSVSTSAAAASIKSKLNNKLDIQALREKRLKREKEEKKKASLILAQNDIFGSIHRR